MVLKKFLSLLLIRKSINMKKIILSILLFIPILINSCGSDEPNELEKYEGIWNAAITTVNAVEGQDSFTTESSSQVEITAGENVLYINGSLYKVVKNTISMPKATVKSSSNGMTIEVSIEATGTLAENEIELQQIMTSKATYPDATVINSTQTIHIVLTK